MAIKQLSGGFGSIRTSGIPGKKYGRGISFSNVTETGTSTQPITSATPNQRFFDINLKSTSTSGHAYGMRIELEKSTSSSGAPRTLTLWCVLSNTTGYGAGGANALHANTYIGAGNSGVVGEAHAAASQLIIAADTRTAQGTWCAHKFVNEFGANNTMPSTTTFFLRFHDAGTVKTPLMFDFSNLTAGASNCIEADTGAVGTPSHYLRCKMPGGATGYMVVYDGHS